MRVLCTPHRTASRGTRHRWTPSGDELRRIGTDYLFGHADFNRELAAELFPESHTRWGLIRFVPPEALSRLAAALADRGYPDETISGILGGDFMRVGRQAWNPTGATAGPSSDHGTVGERAP